MGYYKNSGVEKQNRSSKRNRSSRGGGMAPLDITIEGDSGYTQQFERQQDAAAVQEFNTKIKAWGALVDAALKTSIQTWVKEDKALSGSLKQNYRHWGKSVAKGEEITSIGFAFKESGLFLHLGVGRGYNMTNGTRTISTKDNVWRRQPKPWFNPVIEQFIPELQQIVQEYCGAMIINTTKIFIQNY